MNRVPVLVRLAQLQVLVLFALPGDVVVGALGGAATPATLLGLVLVGWWLASALIEDRGLPSAGGMRLAIATMWFATLMSTLAMVRRGDGALDASDRWLMTLGGVTGLVLVLIDATPRRTDLYRILATAVFATAVSGAVGVVQRLTDGDPSSWLRRLPGLSTNTDTVATRVPRGAVDRVVGTALHPIEFGVVAALVTPLALHLLWFDHRRALWRRGLALMGVASGVVLSVSRSAVLVAVVVGVVVLITSPAIIRLDLLAVTPVALGAVLATNPGTFSALSDSFARLGEDPSVTARLDDLGLAGDLVARHPWWGQGSGTYLAVDVFAIFDNQYLLGAVEHGLIGLGLIVGATLIAPMGSAMGLRRRRPDDATASLAGAVLAISAGSIVAWATFDAWSFPRFGGVAALAMGSLGAAWRLHHPSPSQEDDNDGPVWLLASDVAPPLVDPASRRPGDHRWHLRRRRGRTNL